VTAGLLLAGAVPRLLPSEPTDPAGLAGHTARYGPPPLVPGQRQRDALIAEVDRAGLTGRGGAGFPTARKLAAVAAGRAPVVVANGTEGEPASVKDRVLMACSPHLVLDGAVLAAEITGARRAVIVVHRDVRAVLDEAVAERARARLDRVRLEVRTAAEGFVAGQASAVVQWVQRGVPAPLLGGYFGTWVDAAEVLSRPFSSAGLTDLGAGPGAGLIAALPAAACGLGETARVVRYLASESAGQCGPCVFGLPALAGQVERLAEGRGADTGLLRRWLGQVDGRGGCAHPGGAVRMVRSALRTFGPELSLHTAGRCRGPAGVLPVPRDGHR